MWHIEPRIKLSENVGFLDADKILYTAPWHMPIGMNSDVEESEKFR